MTLPGSDAPASKRYLLMSAEQRCQSSNTSLSLSIASMNAGLVTDRIALVDGDTGELQYLRGARWAVQANELLEQRLAEDLECAGFTVQSGHYQSLGQRRLVCEARALHLRDKSIAEVALSCIDTREGSTHSVVSRHTAPVRPWSADAAVAALSQAYAATLEDVLALLASP
ncbi:MAG: ABC-type transport auxiliary lipoprotein family protein [Pseudomonadota bacterium]